MRYPTPYSAAILAAMLAMLGTACSSSTAPELPYPCVSWCNTVAPWPHDGNPFESEHFTIYSDGASRAALAQLAEIAEEVLTVLMTRFEIPSREMLLLPASQQTIHLYAYKYHYQAEWGAQGFNAGMIIYSPDHPRLTQYTERGHYTRLVTHELTHVVQNTLVGSNHAFSTHTWFEEGLAEVVSELDRDRTIWTEADLNRLVARFGELNPIAIRNDQYPNIERVGVDYFYPMFELTARYLLDDKGLGRLLPDFRDVFLAMREGTSFSSAFESVFGMSVDELQAGFFVRVRQFLP